MENLKKWLEPLLASHGCSLYDLEWDTTVKPPVLRVAIDRLDGPVDLDICAECSDEISARLDETSDIDGEYMLEVCSPGAERELRTPEQIRAQVGKYVYIRLAKPENGLNDVTGTLESFDNDTLVVRYFIKGRPKKAEIPMENAALVMSAVKF